MSNTSLVCVAEFDRAMIIESLRKDHSHLLVGGCEWFETDYGFIVTAANLPFNCVGIAKETNEIFVMAHPDLFSDNILFYSMLQNECDEFRRIDWVDSNGVKCESGEASLIVLTLADDDRPALFERIKKEAKECADFEKSMGL